MYVDALVLRDRDTDGNGSLDERLYALQDANWNTTALINSSGTTQERYTPFGQVTFRDGSCSTLSASAKDWVFLHQGGERIAAGDYEFRNRVYSPSLGRWLNNDPLGFNGRDQNWYRSIGNNPGNGGDPWGLELRKSSLVVDEVPDVPRNPYGFWVPLGPEDSFLGLIEEEARDLGSGIVGMLPGIGDYKDIQEVITGYDLITGKILTPGERILTLGAAFIPGIGAGTARKLGKNLEVVGDVVGKNVDDLPTPTSVWRPDAPTGPRDIPKTYQRPSGFRKGVREKVWEDAKGPDGKVRDPLTGKEIKFDEPWDMGHRPGYEFRKHQKSAFDRGVDRKKFLDEHNNPSHYRPELPSLNRSHRGELLSSEYFGD